MEIAPKKTPAKKSTTKSAAKTSASLTTKDENIKYIIETDPSLNIPDPETPSQPQPIKKRGRKPKGGKLIVKNENASNDTPIVANVILHLKCSLKDLENGNNNFKEPLEYNPEIPPEIKTYEAVNNTIAFSNFQEKDTAIIETTDYAYLNSTKNSHLNICSICKETETEISLKDINTKLKSLKIQLYKTQDDTKKSACFWCTYEYDNEPCYIPKYETNGELFGYGSFCRPECAVGFLMKENMDDSTKFERYHLLNKIYSKIYGFKKNIKPAPNPYYLLEKFYGNLTIQEYRRLLKSEHMLLVLDKPMTRILPELHEDNEDFILNIYGGTKTESKNGGSVYKVKRQSEKQSGPNKNTIIKNNFGIA
jgi:hypothetical protein